MKMCEREKAKGSFIIWLGSLAMSLVVRWGQQHSAVVEQRRIWAGWRRALPITECRSCFIDKCETGVVSDGGRRTGEEGRINVSSRSVECWSRSRHGRKKVSSEAKLRVLFATAYTIHYVKNDSNCSLRCSSPHSSIPETKHTACVNEIMTCSMPPFPGLFICSLHSLIRLLRNK